MAQWHVRVVQKGSDPPGCQLDIVHYVYEELMLGQYRKNDRTVREQL